VASAPSYQNLTEIALVFYDSLDGLRYFPLAMNERQHTSAFVLQFQPGVNVDEGRVEGRVEHVASGEVKHFDSLEQLLVFLKLG